MHKQGGEKGKCIKIMVCRCFEIKKNQNGQTRQTKGNRNQSKPYFAEWTKGGCISFAERSNGCFCTHLRRIVLCSNASVQTLLNSEVLRNPLKASQSLKVCSVQVYMGKWKVLFFYENTNSLVANLLRPLSCGLALLNFSAHCWKGGWKGRVLITDRPK